MNTYSYEIGNPISATDPFGLMNLQIPGTDGDTTVHANPGPDVTPPGTRTEHLPSHVHLGDNNGPRIRTDTWEPYSPEDEARMTRTQKKFCKNLTDSQKSLIQTRQTNVYKYGRRLMSLMAAPALGMDSLSTSCRQDPFFCMESFPYVFDRYEPAQCDNECNL